MSERVRPDNSRETKGRGAENSDYERHPQRSREEVAKALGKAATRGTVEKRR